MSLLFNLLSCVLPLSQNITGWVIYIKRNILPLDLELGSPLYQGSNRFDIQWGPLSCCLRSTVLATDLYMEKSKGQKEAVHS